ncbi:hypothetical protein NA56DRAFT_645882 [Hyaloscypha hepaticicola]|uniref:Uncharacterized protein n=1 Tax=Hyaloscypha hepaticicola TaxID=2082293 RepID=A0A2J6Q4F9_9HELO|nr:hypothetical protein NA56DRAFT_645882 [Hyaloscypha hepaticicola]
MDETEKLAYARGRSTTCGSPKFSRDPESYDRNEFKVQGETISSQGRRGSYDYHYAATYPPAKKEWRHHRLLPTRKPLTSTHANIKHYHHGVSAKRKEDTCYERNLLNIKTRQSPEFVDVVSLSLYPIKFVPLVNGSVVQKSEEMESSHGSAEETTGISGREVVTQTNKKPGTSLPGVTSQSGAYLEDAKLGTTSFNASSKTIEIQLYALLQRIRRLGETVWGLRSKVQEQRVILRSKQYAKAAADDQYMRLARLKESGADERNVLVSSEGRTLQELFQDCEKVRAEYGPLEDDCNALEDQLGSQEYELTRLEENFVRICNSIVPLDSGPSSPENIREGQSESSSSDVHQIYHPLVAEYFSKLGDVEIFRERLERHQEEREALEAGRETRQRVNHSLAPEDQAWLEQAEELQNEILKDLAEAQADAEELKRKCLVAELLDENGEPKDFQTQFQTQEQEAFAGDVDVDAKGQTSDYVKFPNLLPQSGTKDMKFKDSAPRPDELSESAGDHINQWLLHTLRSSPLDANLLARTFEAQVGNFEAQKWEIDVRNHWYRDGAIKDASGYQIESIESETPVYGRSKLSTASFNEYNIEPVLGITGRGTAVSDTSSVSGSVFLRTDEENEMAVGPLPRSKYDRTRR